VRSVFKARMGSKHWERGNPCIPAETVWKIEGGKKKKAFTSGGVSKDGEDFKGKNGGSKKEGTLIMGKW